MPATRIRAYIYIGMARRKEHFIYAARVLSHAILFRGTRSLAREPFFPPRVARVNARARSSAIYRSRREVLLAIVKTRAYERASERSISSRCPSGIPPNPRVCFPYQRPRIIDTSQFEPLRKEKKKSEKEREERRETKGERERERERERNHSIVRSYNRHERRDRVSLRGSLVPVNLTHARTHACAHA